jgi:hypothetical protein
MQHWARTPSSARTVRFFPKDVADMLRAGGEALKGMYAQGCILTEELRIRWDAKFQWVKGLQGVKDPMGPVGTTASPPARTWV